MMPAAWCFKNSLQEGPVDLGAGPMPVGDSALAGGDRGGSGEDCGCSPKLHTSHALPEH